MGFCRRFVVGSVVSVCACLALAAVCQAVEPKPVTPGAAPVLAETTLRFVRQDAELWRSRTAELDTLLTAARKRADAAAKLLSDVKQALQKLDQETIAAQAELKSLLPPGTKTKPLAAANPEPAQKGTVDPKSESPQKSPEKKDPAKPEPTTGLPSKSNDAEVAKVRERLQKSLEQQTQKRKELTQVEQDLKQAQTLRDALQKAHQEAKTLSEQAGERITLLTKTPHTAKAENTRLIQTFAAPRPVLVARWNREGRGFFAGIHGSDVLHYDLYHGSAGLSKSGQPGPAYDELKGHHSWVASLAVAPVGEPTLMSASYNGHLIRWDLRDDNATLGIDRLAHQGFVRAVAYSPDGQLVATCGNDLVVRVWKPSGTLVKELRGHASHVYNVAFHPSGKSLVSGDLMGILKQWDTTSWQQARELDAKVLEKYDEVFYAHCGGIRSLDFSPDGKQLVVSGVSDVTNAFAGIAVPTAVLFDWESGKRLRVLKPQNTSEGSCWGVRFSPAGDFIVGAGGRGSGSLWFWKPTDEKSYFDLRLPNVPYDVQFHPDGLRLLLPLYDATIRVYDLGPKAEPAAPAVKPAEKGTAKTEPKKAANK